MAHISVPEGAPGIRGLMMTHPEQTRPMNELANALLHADGTLTQGEREIIASYVSNGNNCKYCATVHTAIAAHQMGGNYDVVRAVLQDPSTAPITEKLKSAMFRYVEGFPWLAGDFKGFVPSYALLNVSVGVQIMDGLRLGVAMNNVLDRRHYEIYGGSIIPRLTYATVSYTF